MIKKIFITLILGLNSSNASSSDEVASLSKVIFVVMSQSHPRQQKITNETESHLKTELQKSGLENPIILFFHRDLNVFGNWAIVPVLPLIYKVACIHKQVKWFAFLHPEVGLNVQEFNKLLLKYKEKRTALIGRMLTDLNPSELHYFDDSKILYPDLAPGFLISRNLVRVLISETNNYSGKSHLKWPKHEELNRDVSFDLATAIFSPSLQQTKPEVINDSSFCTDDRNGCALYMRKLQPKPSLDLSKEVLHQTLFVVTTCQKFHEERLSLIQQTWAKSATNLIYVSEMEDSQFKTTVLPGADFNVENGPCLKVQAAFRHFFANAKEKNWKWMVLVEDDTSLSVAKILEVIQNNLDEEGDVAIGNVLGSHNSIKSTNEAFDFFSAGSGKIFNYNLIQKLANLNGQDLRCSMALNREEGMIGSALFHLKVNLIHNERFHQFSPEEYDSSLLKRREPITFHKVKSSSVYQTWFQSEDANLRSYLLKHSEWHSDL